MSETGRYPRIPAALRLLALAVAASCAFLAIWWGALNQDEGWYLYAARLVREGRIPYRDFFFTQGPTFPFVYSVLSPVWDASSPLHGLLGGRAVTYALGVLATLCACALVRRLVPPDSRPASSIAVFALLSCNLYHVYFTTIPKTYALGSLFLLAGFLLAADALGVGRAEPPALPRRIAGLFAGGLSLAFASGTRISLLLAIPATGLVLLLSFRRLRWAFLWFGLGAAAGLFLTYGMFALDGSCRAGLLAAQKYHAARGGFDPFFALGSVSRLVRGYAALGATLFAAIACRRENGAQGGLAAPERALSLSLGFSFAAVLLLQLSAPFPYDDYQTPIMGVLAVLVVSWYFRRGGNPHGKALFAVLAAGMVSMSSPMIQQWMTYPQDRFWSEKKNLSDLERLRLAADAVNLLDPGGDTLFTQDLYLAVEAGRKVPEGLEMGPFSYFPGLTDSEARARRVLSTGLIEKMIDEAPSPVAAFSGYSFAIAAPECSEVPFERQKEFFTRLKKHYREVDSELRFGQNSTTLTILRRREEDGKPSAETKERTE